MIQSVSFAEEAETDSVLEEVLVTAQRRGAERLQDVPMSVSVIDAELIRKIGLLEMNDYLRALPSTNFIDRGAGLNNVIIRGIAANLIWEDTVAVYIGDTPVTGLGAGGIGNPDLKMVDIERVEVLRGPQGTLYGAGSMGGTVRIIPAPPKTDRIEARVTGKISMTGGEGGGNSALEGMLNLPFLDGDAALRFVAYRHDNSGYYRNVAGSDPETLYWGEVYGAPAEDRDDIGESTYTGWRAQLLWQPTPDLSFKLMALGQDIDQTGKPEGEPGLPDFQQARFGKFDGGGESIEMDFDLTNLEVAFDAEHFSLLSTTSLVKSQAGIDTLSKWLGQNMGLEDIIPVWVEWAGPATSFTQEFRLTSRQDGRFRYQAGFFYQDVDSSVDHIHTFEGDPSLDPFGGATLLDALGEFDTRQKAIFGEISYDLTNHLTMSGGLRWYQYDQSTLWSGGGVFAGVDYGEDLTTSEDDGTNYSLKLEYEASESTRIYGSFNQGFRLGGPHPTLPPTICDADNDGVLDGSDIPVPKLISSDYVDSYEAGIKYRSPNGHLSFYGTVYLAEWRGIPVESEAPCGWAMFLNAGKAESRGAEIEVRWAPLEGLLIDFAASWMRPELAKDDKYLGQAGDRLPGSPEYNLHFGIEYDFKIGQRDAFVRADVVSVGEYVDDLREKTGITLGDYTTVGLRGGVAFKDVLLELYASNLTDEFALTYIEWGAIYYNALKPRTFGVQLTYQFSNQ